MKTTQKLMAAAVVAATTAHQAMAAITFEGSDRGKVNENLKGDNNAADTTIQVLISRAMMFLALIAVCYGLYGGFLMLTAGGDEKKVEQGKKILFQVALGLVVIFLANSIVQFVLTKVLA